MLALWALLAITGAPPKTTPADASPEQRQRSHLEAAADELSAEDVGAYAKINPENIEDGLPTFVFEHTPPVNPDASYTYLQVEQLFAKAIVAGGREPDTLFNALDKDHDGVLRGDEVRLLGLAVKKPADNKKNENLGVDIKGFTARYKLWLKGGKQGEPASVEQILSSFEALDSDKNGVLDDEEIEAIGQYLDMELVQAGNKAVEQMRQREQERAKLRGELRRQLRSGRLIQH